MLKIDYLRGRRSSPDQVLVLFAPDLARTWFNQAQDLTKNEPKTPPKMAKNESFLVIFDPFPEALPLAGVG